MTVSVIIPVYNGERYLESAVASIRAQNHADLEIVLIDDGSTDGTASLLSRLGADVRWTRQSNTGPAAARNRGLELAHGALIAFLDADDLWPVGSLVVLQDALSARPDADIALGKAQYLHSDGPAFTAAFLGCGLFRRGVFDRVGLFEPSLLYSEDLDWFCRAREKGVAMHFVEQTTLFHRRHAQGMTHGRDCKDLNILRVLKRSLDRRRECCGPSSETSP